MVSIETFEAASLEYYMSQPSDYKLTVANNSLMPLVISALKENGLPTSDIDTSKHFFLLTHGGRVAATGGLEFFEDCGLLRSVTVKKELRKTGLGRMVNEELEKISRQNGVRSLYLLTTSAKEFFEKLGYLEIHRSHVPPAIRNTAEFSSLCPCSATLMKKTLL